jgi:tRNA 2-thiouridine synthesizing protein A
MSEYVMNSETYHPDATVTTNEESLTPQFDRILDTRGLNCPLPILKTKLELTRMKAGEVLQVLTTDPLAPLDFRAFCVRTQHQLLHLIETEEQCKFFIRKATL